MFQFDVVLFIFAFVAFVLGSKIIKTLPRPTSKRLSTIFSSKSFMVSGLRLMSLIHLSSFLCMM